MEKLKLFSEILEPDPRSSMFMAISPDPFREHYDVIAGIKMNATVPDDIRSYFASAQNLSVYGWFAYGLYATVNFVCLTICEMALRKRIPLPTGGKDRRGLRNLLELAANRGLISEKGFTHMRQMRSRQADELRRMKQIYRHEGIKMVRPKRDYGRVLAQAMPLLRNEFAHARIHTILPAGYAIFELRFTAELINQLFPG